MTQDRSRDSPHSLDRRRAFKRSAALGLSWFIPGCRPTPPEASSQAADRHFAQGAFRIDLVHLRAGAVERFEPRRLRIENQWAGPKKPLTDAPDWGDYRLSIYEPGTEALLFRQGFDSTVDAQALSAATRLSLRIPLPQRAIHAVIEKRRAGNAFQQILNATFDPAAFDVDRSAPAIATQVEPLLSHGAPDTKVDVAILGDGYGQAEYSKFVADAQRAASYLFSVEPFRKRMRDFNVHAVFAASPESGVTDPYLGQKRTTLLGCAYGQGEAERTLAAADTYAVHEIASAVPYDFVLILANTRRYGGSAHFGGPAVAAIDSAAARYLVLHEFAHVIGGLADEYYISVAHGPAFTGNVEPWHPNVTLSADKAKWRLSTDATVPTAWNKAEYDKYFSGYVQRYLRLRERHVAEAVVEQFMHDDSRRQAALLAKNGRDRIVGLFEGAHGYAQGVFRAEANCIMFSLQTDYFCAACVSAIERMIDAQCA